MPGTAEGNIVFSKIHHSMLPDTIFTTKLTFYVFVFCEKGLCVRLSVCHFKFYKKYDLP